MKFLSKVKLSNRRYKTPEGYLVCVDSIIARTGKQEYLKSEIFQDSNDDSVIQIDRPKSEVLSPSTIASFENKPLVDEHPDEDVNVDNYRDYAIGFARDVRASKLDDVDILIANLIFTDPEAIAEIESGEKTELSCGYDCDILGEGDNLYQANIRGNHIALCKAGRAGIARIQDSKMKDSKIKLSRQDALDIFEDIEDDIYWYNSMYNCRFNLNDNYLIIEGNRENLKNIIKEYGLDFYNVKIIDSVKDSSEDDFYDELFSSNIKYEFIKGGYGIKFKTPRDYQKAKEIAKRTRYTKGKWYDKDLEFFEYGGITISNEDSVKDSKYSKLLKDLSPEERLSKIDELIADEEEAIVGYKEAMKYANEADKSVYAHIIAEELEHITELKTLRAENFEKNNINDAGTTRRMFRESEIGDENSWFGTTDWGTPKGNMYIYRKNGKIIAEGVYNSWDNDLQKGEKKEFNSVKELNKWLNTFTEDSSIKDIEKKEFTKDEENKKMKDGALKGIHLKKIRNTLRNEDEDLVEDFLDYMDTRPDLVKEYDDYSDYMVREDFETWKKYKKIKARDVDTYEEVTEGLEKELKDSDTLKNLAYKFAQMGNYFDRGNSANSRDILGREDNEKIAEFYKLGLQVYKQLEQEVNYLKNNKEPRKSPLSFWERNETVDLLLDGAERLVWVNNSKCEALGNKIRNLIKDYKKYNYKDSKVKDKLENKPINILIKFDSSKEANDALKSLQRKEKFMNSKLVANDTIKVMTTDIDYEELKNILKLYFIKNIKTIDSKVNNSEKLLNIIKLYKKVTKDSKVKDTHFTVSSNRNSEEFNSEEELLKKYKIEGYDTVRGIKAPKLKGLMGPFFNGNGKILYETKERYGSYDSCKDSKLKDGDYEKIVEKVLDKHHIYLDDVDYVEETSKGVVVACTDYLSKVKVESILKREFGRIKSDTVYTILLDYDDIRDRSYRRF